MKKIKLLIIATVIITSNLAGFTVANANGRIRFNIIFTPPKEDICMSPLKDCGGGNFADLGRICASNYDILFAKINAASAAYECPK